MSLGEFLENAELQVETAEQRAELTKALGDLAELPVERLADKIYGDYQGKPNQWTAMEILKAYFCTSKAPLGPEETVLLELREPEVRNRFKDMAKRMIEKCIHHPGRPSAGLVFGKNYCQKCVDGINGAVAKVDKHVEPKACFITYKGGDIWEPITGTGCAHWVAHQLGINRGEKCLNDRTLKVTELITGMTEISRVNVAVNNIWANEGLDHCGLVVKVEPKAGSPPNRITIRHDSSARGGVFDNDFDSHFGGGGKFYR